MANARCSHQNHSTLTIGKRKPARCATALEVRQIDEAIAALKKAKSTDSEKVMLVNVSEAFKISRTIFRSRNDL